MLALLALDFLLIWYNNEESADGACGNRHLTQAGGREEQDGTEANGIHILSNPAGTQSSRDLLYDLLCSVSDSGDGV